MATRGSERRHLTCVLRGKEQRQGDRGWGVSEPVSARGFWAWTVLSSVPIVFAAGLDVVERQSRMIPHLSA